jgi:dihydroorotate dehydrogenase
MLGPLRRIGQRALFAIDPETAHGLSIAALKSGVPLCGRPTSTRRLETTVCGLAFANPLGMAAGYDKNAEVPDALLRLGFGFVEVGTVTPLPQAGNPRPRVFRLSRDGAVINRLGFNNEGHQRAFDRLSRRRRQGIVGVNIGANRDSADRIADYATGVRRFAGVADYLTVNISSPNTPGLRAMQARASLAELLAAVTAARTAAIGPNERPTPIFLKIAPDLDEAELDGIAGAVAASAIDGVIVSNTTTARPNLASRAFADEPGGLSGPPLFARSTAVLARMRRLLGPGPALIGVGGVASAEDALEKIRAGADLVQLYTGMIYAGPGLPGDIVRAMARHAEREGLASIAAIRDSRVDHWAAHTLAVA